MQEMLREIERAARRTAGRGLVALLLGVAGLGSLVGSGGGGGGG